MFARTHSHISVHCRIAAATLIVLALPGCGYLPESSFTLANESRLPKWFILEHGQTRDDVKVTMDYYLNQSGATAKFTLRNSWGITIKEETGHCRGIYPLKRKEPPPGFPDGYPSYEVISVGEQTEIIEHRRMESIFYVTDDPAVLSEFAEHATTNPPPHEDASPTTLARTTELAR